MPSLTALAPELSTPPRPTRAPASIVIDCEVRDAPPRPMHVALALGGTDLGRSGIGTYVRELLPPLIEQLNAHGGKLTVFGHRAELTAYAPALAGARSHAIRIPTNPGLNALWYLTSATRLATRLRADVLLLPAANRRIAARGGLPTVAVVHDLAQLRVEKKYDWLRMAYFKHVLLRAFHTPGRLVAVSHATRRDLEQTLGLPPERLRVVYNGVNTARFKAISPDSPAVADVRRQAGLAARPYLLYPARLEHPGKNHLRLLKAFARSGLAATHTLALSGADWGAEKLIREKIVELDLHSSVALLGFVSEQNLPGLVAGADAVLMLGLHEGFGLPALEGLSAGRPVCVANTGALPEVVGECGVQCDPLDTTSIAAALVRVVRDEPLRTHCRLAGPAWAERFTWARTARGLIDVCQEILP